MEEEEEAWRGSVFGDGEAVVLGLLGGEEKRARPRHPKNH